jgi:hypothetical protein
MRKLDQQRFAALVSEFTVIYCTAPHVDDKRRSKWARALRFAAANKPDDESITKFIKRNGGINACASRYAQYVRHLGKD